MKIRICGTYNGKRAYDESASADTADKVYNRLFSAQDVAIDLLDERILDYVQITVTADEIPPPTGAPRLIPQPRIVYESYPGNVVLDRIEEYRTPEPIAPARPAPRADGVYPDGILYRGDFYTFADLLDSVITLDCGCLVEPDGTCPCGTPSPLLAHGLI